MKRVLILCAAVVLSGCWSIRPAEYIEFNEPIATDRSILPDALDLSMEKDGARLVGAALLGPGRAAFYYVPRTVALHPAIDATDIASIDLYVAGEVRPADHAVEFADALERFPHVLDYREKRRGYETPDEEEIPGFLDPQSITVDQLRWEFAFGVPARAGSDVAAAPLSVHVVAVGDVDDDTDRITVFLETDDGRAARLDLPRTTFSVKRGLDAEVQRFMRAIVWNGTDTAIVSDRVVDLDSGDSYRLVDRAPTAYVEQILTAPGSDVVTIVFGDSRVSKRIIDAPLSRPIL
jgi:hypothetical protein